MFLIFKNFYYFQYYFSFKNKFIIKRIKKKNKISLKKNSIKKNK